MTINWRDEIPSPLPEELLMEARRDARAGNCSPDRFVIAHMGDRPRAFDPESFQEDRGLVYDVSQTARRDELRQDTNDAHCIIGSEPRRTVSGTIAAGMIFLEWLIAREMFAHAGFDTPAANGMAILAVIATVVAVSLIRPVRTEGRS